MQELLTTSGRANFRFPAAVFRKMKMAGIMLVILLLQTHINAYSQTSNFDISVTGKMSDVFKEIEKQSGFRFFYDESMVNVEQQVSVNARQKSIDDVLKEVFANTTITYKIYDHYVLVFPKGTKDDVVRNLLPASAKQQPGTITGKVVGSQNEPLPFVNVLVKGTSVGTLTDDNGTYTITVPANTTDPVLLFSFVGFIDKEETIGNRTVVNTTLAEEVSQLEEVVVVGYGVQKKVNLTGAGSSLNADGLDNRPISNSTQALQGVQGLYVNQAGGQPGQDGATIRIRGQGTLNNNDPLVLVDGIEFPLSAINPNDIESVSVLKDAASAAIYGARAANGVVLVKTKGGKKGGFQIEYNNYFGMQKPTYLPDVVKDPVFFMEMRNIAQINEGKITPDFDPAMIEEYRQGMGVDPYTYPQNDWFDIMFNNAFIMEHNLRFSGGDEKYTYSASVGYNKQDGVLRGTDAEKYTVALNTTAKVAPRLTIGSNFNGSYNIMNSPAAGVANLMEMTFKAQGYHPTYLKDGRYANTFVRTPGHNVYRHPLALADEGKNEELSQYILVNMFAEYNFPLDIKYKLNVGINKFDYKQTRFVPDVYEYQVKTEEALRIDFGGMQRHTRKKDRNDMNKTISQTLNWEKRIRNDHHIQALFGFSYEDFYTSDFFAQREGYLGNTLTEINAGSTNPSVEGTSAKSVLMSYFGRVNYNWREKYLLEANFRYDGSSRFAKGHRWGIFPSFSAGWRMDQEGFMKDANWIDHLKLRASWGQLGNERIDMFRYINLIDLGHNYPFNNTISGGAAVTAYNDPDITWETTTIANIGIDATFFNRKLDVVFEVFNKRTSDILREVNLASQVGSLKGPIRNIGTVDNKGLELGLTYRNNISDFRYEVSGNLTYIKNEIVDLKGQTIINDMFILKEGHPIDSYYLIQANGIFQSMDEVNNSPFQTANTKAGYLRYEDYVADDEITEADRKISKGVIPKLTYSFSINLGWKNFDLNAFFQGVQGVYTYGDRINATPFWFGCGLPWEWVNDSWTEDRRDAKLPILTTYEGSLNENFRKSDFWLRNASYLRLKNLQISYTLPTKIVEKVGIKKLKVFVNGQNLLTFSPMKQFDPEKDIKKSTWYEYPSVKTYSAGLNVVF